MTIDAGDIFTFALALSGIGLIALIGIGFWAWCWRWPRFLGGRCPCGYPTKGLPRGSPCPECGAARIAENPEPSAIPVRRSAPVRLFITGLCLPMALGIAVLSVTTALDRDFPGALLSPFALCLLPYVVHSVPVLVMGRRAPLWWLLVVGGLPAITTAGITGMAFLLDYRAPRQSDDFMYPFTLFIIATVLAVPWSLLCSIAALFATALARERAARAVRASAEARGASIVGTQG